MGTRFRVRRGPLLAALTLLLALSSSVAWLAQTSAPAEATTVTVECRNTRADAAAIQSVINNSATSDEIVIDGPCLIDSTIVLLGDRSYRGESVATTLKAAPGSNLPAVLASDAWVITRRTTTGSPISLRDLTIDANGSANPTGGDGVVIRSWNTQIDDVRILDAPDNGLRVTGRGSDGTDLGPSNTQVNGSINGVFVVNPGQHGIFVEDQGNAVTDWHLRDSWIGGTGGDGIRLENSAGWTISGNHTYDVAGSGIAAYRMFATSITDNYIEDFGTGYGLYGLVQGTGASVVQGNRIFQVGTRNGGVMLALTGVSTGAPAFVVSGNVLVGNGTGTGLSYATTGGALRVVSVDNNVSGVKTPRTLGANVTLSKSY